jgi:outer membrane biosynthesis protein TonB
VFDKLARMQNRVLSREIIVTDGRNKILTFNVDVTDVDPNQKAALIPEADATPVAMEESPTLPSLNMISKKAPPVYPPAAKTSHVTGTVILDTMIGKDGRIKDMRVLGTPSPLLTPAATCS